MGKLGWVVASSAANNLPAKYIAEYERAALAMKPSLCSTKSSANWAWAGRVRVERAALR